MKPKTLLRLGTIILLSLSLSFLPQRRLDSGALDFPSIYTKEDIDCLAKTIHHEARGEPLTGKIAVAWVVLNRVSVGKSVGKFPDSICGVVNQKISGSCQFSWQCVKMLPTRIEKENYDLSYKILYNVSDKKYNDPTNGSLYFNNTPFESNKLKKQISIGNHIFYSEKI